MLLSSAISAILLLTISLLVNPEFAAAGGNVKTIAVINAGGPTIQTADGTVYEQDR